MTDPITQQRINQTAWAACDTFRGAVDAGQYKDYILVMLFLKTISDLWQDHQATYRQQYGDDETRIRRRLERERFILPKGASFEDLYARRNLPNIGELIALASKAAPMQTGRTCCLSTPARTSPPGKNRNTMGETHINKVLDTYRARAAVEQYAHLASPEEITENGYTLNIPRYVDTFEPEEDIDLAAVQQHIEHVESELAEVRAKMAGYLKELGIHG